MRAALAVVLAVLAFTVGTAEAADTRWCVSWGEVSHLASRLGDININQVHRRLDGNTGTRAAADSGGVGWEIRKYRTCDRRPYNSIYLGYVKGVLWSIDATQARVWHAQTR